MNVVSAPEYIDWVFTRLIQSPLHDLLKQLPSQCAVCRSWPAAPVCSACMARFSGAQPRCKTCAIGLAADLSQGRRTSPEQCIDCIRHTPPVDSMLAALDYAYPWSALVSACKFGEQPAWAPFFADLLLAAPGVRTAFEGLDKTDLILPVPLSKERLQTRGFNQAWELAHALTRQSGTCAKADNTLLMRVINTRPQTELLRHERLANVKNAFQVDPLRALDVKGKRVLLVDDVMTSGASIFTAALALRAAGAAHITGMVLTRTPL